MSNSKNNYKQIVELNCYTWDMRKTSSLAAPCGIGRDVFP